MSGPGVDAAKAFRVERTIRLGLPSADGEDSADPRPTTEVESEKVIKLYAKAYDVDAQDTIMVASPKLSEDAQSFAKHYQIKVFEADKLVDAEIDIQI